MKTALLKPLVSLGTGGEALPTSGGSPRASVESNDESSSVTLSSLPPPYTTDSTLHGMSRIVT